MKSLSIKNRLIIGIIILLSIFLTLSCEQEDPFEDSVEAIDTSIEADQKIYIDDPDFGPPRNIPNPPSFDARCVVRLAYLSYLGRCPENNSVVNGWIQVLLNQGFDDLAAGFILSPEASVKWNTQYNHFLNRTGVSSHEINKLVYIAYRGLLLREPDVNGGKYWTTVLYQRGIKDVANGIGNSPEFRRRLDNIQTECINAANNCQY